MFSFGPKLTLSFIVSFVIFFVPLFDVFICNLLESGCDLFAAHL